MHQTDDCPCLVGIMGPFKGMMSSLPYGRALGTEVGIEGIPEIEDSNSANCFKCEIE